MKKSILFISCILAATMLTAQVPSAIKYQSVVRDGLGAVLANKIVSFRFSVIEGTVTGAIVYSERHSTLTNEFGLVNLEIGRGTPVTGTLDGVNWGVDKHFLKVELDPSGGSAFALMGTSELMSVPYALRAKTVEIDNVNDADADPANEIQVMSLSGNNLSLSKGGGTVTLPSTGDNWGTQFAITDATLSGNGTGSFPLGLAQRGATTGQMLKWNGTTWMPANDLTGSSLWQQNGSKIYYNTGSVGIGTDNPMTGLHINSGGVFSGLLLTNDASGTTFYDGLLIGHQYQADYVGNRYAIVQNQENSRLGFGTNGRSTDINISPDGNVGIGTGLPDAKLHVAGQIRITGGNPGDGKVLTSDANGLGTWQTPGGGGGTPGGSSGHVQFNNAGAFGGDANFFWDNTNKKLGLGTSSPNYQFTINGGANFTEIQMINNTTGALGTDGLRLGIGTGIPNAWLWSHENAELYFGTNNIRRMTIKGDGNVGIGTATPGGLLELYTNSTMGSPNLLLTETEGDYARLMFKNTVVPAKNWTIAGKPDATDANSLLNFWYWNGTSGVDIMSISGLGRVGIGTYNPTYNVTVYGGVGGSEINFTNDYTGNTQYDGLRVGTSSAGGNSWVWNYENAKLYFGTNNAERLSILGNGNVGIGDTSPDATLDVEGTVMLGVNGVSFSELREITGTTGTGGNSTIPYPSGYTLTNIRILSLEINYNGNSWVGQGGTDNPTTNISKVFYYLTSSNIYIYYPAVSQFQSKAFRMLVMKVE